MSRSQTAKAAVLVAVLLAALVGWWPESSTSAATSVVPPSADAALGVAGGEVPDGVTVFEDDYPAVAYLGIR